MNRRDFFNWFRKAPVVLPLMVAEELRTETAPKGVVIDSAGNVTIKDCTFHSTGNGPAITIGETEDK